MTQPEYDLAGMVWVSYLYEPQIIVSAIFDDELEARRHAMKNGESVAAVHLGNLLSEEIA